jgi:glycosyltransferase involved in cell wall biosynthesis
VVSHGETGLLVRVGDAAQLAEAIATLLANPESRARMGAAGRRRMAQLFDEDRIATKYLSLYDELRDESRDHDRAHA